MKQPTPSLLEALRDLEKAIANAEALQSGSLDLLKRAAQTLVSEIFESNPQFTDARGRYSSPHKLKKPA